MNSKTIYVFAMPAIGHLNPILPLVKELVVRKFKVVVYCIEVFKEKIDKTGAEFRSYEKGFDYDLIQEIVNSSGKKSNAFTLLRNVQEATDSNLMKLVKDIDEGKPDLIIHDLMAIHAKWVIRYIKESFKNSAALRAKNQPNMIIPSNQCPPVIDFAPTFLMYKGIYPNQEETALVMNMSFLEKLSSIPGVIGAMLKAKSMASKYGVPYVSPLDDMHFGDPESKTIVFTYQEFQPRAELYPTNKRFVGACIDETVHINGVEKIDNEKLKELLNQLPLREEQQSKTQKLKLIYVSLGSMLRDNMPFYLKVLEAFKTFDQSLANKQDNNSVKFEDMRIIISAGAKCYEEFQKNKTEIPANILIVPAAPQLEILKRASIFVTHCGMNSTNEALYFGVPMICVPVGADQPLLAHRLSKDLKLGVKLDLNTFKPIDLQNALHTILSDSTFDERSRKFSEVCRKSIGQKNGADFIVENLANNSN